MRIATQNTGNVKKSINSDGVRRLLSGVDVLHTQENWIQPGEQELRRVAKDRGFGVIQDDGNRSNVYERQNAAFYRKDVVRLLEPIYIRQPGSKKRWAVGGLFEDRSSKREFISLGWHAEAWQRRNPLILNRARAQGQAVLDWLSARGWQGFTVLAGDFNIGVGGASLKPLLNAGFTDTHQALKPLNTFGSIILDHIMFKGPGATLLRHDTLGTGSDHRALIATFKFSPVPVNTLVYRAREKFEEGIDLMKGVPISRTEAWRMATRIQAALDSGPKS